VDWFAAFSLFAGILATIMVAAWYFYKQQKLSLTDIFRLFAQIQSQLGDITATQKFVEFKSVIQQLARLEESVRNLKESIGSITASVAAETKRQQESLLKDLSIDHTDHIRKARDVLILALRKEFDRVSSDKGNVDGVVSTITDLVEHSILNMGKYLDSNYREYIEDALSKQREMTVIALREILVEVSDFQSQVSDLPVLRESRREKSNY